MKSGSLAFTWNVSAGFDRLFEKIRNLFSLQEETVVPVDEQYLDTFDWRLYTTGLVLRQKGTRFILASHSGMPVLEASGPRKFRYMSECFRRFFPAAPMLWKKPVVPKT